MRSAGGNGLAFACDFRIALVDTTFVLSEVKRGLVPAIISKYLYVFLCTLRDEGD